MELETVLNNPAREVDTDLDASMEDFPEGGRAGWLTVFGAWAAMFFTFGYLNAFGVYEAYYSANQLQDRSPSDIAWIGSVQFFFQFSAALISGPVNDKHGPRIIIWPSSVLLVLSIMLTSICKTYTHFLLAQGFLGGLSSGLVYAPALSVIGHYFKIKRPIMMAIASSGSSLGGIIFPIMITRLLNNTSVGFGWTLRILGFIVLFLCLIACAAIVPRVPPRKGSYLLLNAFKDPAYSFQVIGLFLFLWGLFTPFFYLSLYSEDQGMSTTLAFYLVAILNGGSLLGRILGGGMAMRFGPLNVLALSCTASSILLFCWLRMTSNLAIILFSVLLGATSGAVIAIFPATIAQIARKPDLIGTYIGMAMAVGGVAVLTGPPITGAFIRRYNGYDEAIVFSGVVSMAGSLFIFGASFVQCRHKVQLKLEG